MKFKVTTIAKFQHEYIIEAENEDNLQRLIDEDEFFPERSDWKDEEIILTEEI